MYIQYVRCITDKENIFARKHVPLQTLKIIYHYFHRRVVIQIWI